MVHVIITGVSQGLGEAIARELLARGARVLGIGRRTSPRLAGDAYRFVECDLANVTQLPAFVGPAFDDIASHAPHAVCLLNNAATLDPVGVIGATEADAIGRSLCVNLTAPIVLAGLFCRSFTSDAVERRIVNVSSGAHAGHRLDFDDLMSERDYRHDRVYGRTKLANILFTRELARRLEGTGVTVNAVHPGVIATGLLADYMGMPAGKRSFGATPERGAEPLVYLAASPEVAGVSGRFFDRCEEARSSAASYDEAAARRLWEESLRLVGAAVGAPRRPSLL